MSESDRRLRTIAIGLAALAMVVALVTAIVVVRRGSEQPPAPAPIAEPEKPVVPAIIEKTVLASDVIRLQRGSLEAVVENGQTIGMRVMDGTLGDALGLETDDVIVSLSGRPIARDLDAYDAIFNLSMMSSTTMYVEIKRGSTPALVRWKLDGDLRQARYANSGNTLGGMFHGKYTPPPLPQADPMFDTIEKIDDTHVKLPRKTAEYIFNNPMASLKGANVVFVLGQPSGVKLYTIRPSSLFAKLGLLSNDKIEEINGVAITAPDKALDVYAKLQKADEVTIELTRKGNRMQLHITITK